MNSKIRLMLSFLDSNTLPPISWIIEIHSKCDSLAREFLSFCDVNGKDRERVEKLIKEQRENLDEVKEDLWKSFNVNNVKKALIQYFIYLNSFVLPVIVKFKEEMKEESSKILSNILTSMSGAEVGRGARAFKKEEGKAPLGEG
jgi:hypothetical protein